MCDLMHVDFTAFLRISCGVDPTMACLLTVLMGLAKVVNNSYVLRHAKLLLSEGQSSSDQMFHGDQMRSEGVMLGIAQCGWYPPTRLCVLEDDWVKESRDV